MYAPRGVWTDGERVIVVDSGNHRVLVWHTLPDRDGAPADVVIGQPDMTTEGPKAGGVDIERGLHLPTGVLVIDGQLLIADAWHHRVLIYNDIPEVDYARPDGVLGQHDLTCVTENRGGSASRTTMWWPYGLGLVDGILWVADTGNRRVLGWSEGLPDSPDQPADILLGQDTDDGREENRGGPVSGDSYRWPHDIAGTADILYLADAGNHRVCAFKPAPTLDRPADAVLGQRDANSSLEWPYGPQGPDKMRFPYGVSVDGARLAVADTANNRVLLWDGLPVTTADPAHHVIGQPDFAANGENHWTMVSDDSLCWPYGLHLCNDLLVIADSGNNRAVIWRRA